VYQHSRVKVVSYLPGRGYKMSVLIFRLIAFVFGVVKCVHRNLPESVDILFIVAEIIFGTVLPGSNLASLFVIIECLVDASTSCGQLI
jgi:hypothetical protein